MFTSHPDWGCEAAGGGGGHLPVFPLQAPPHPRSGRVSLQQPHLEEPESASPHRRGRPHAPSCCLGTCFCSQTCIRKCICKVQPPAPAPAPRSMASYLCSRRSSVQNTNDSFAPASLTPPGLEPPRALGEASGVLESHVPLALFSAAERSHGCRQGAGCGRDERPQEL